ncbi:putative non-ribosomal peptide synthetase [Pseudomonas putida S610]|nr:putative non-ribosomal peptide synthetase [Pseudomonas putida S610]
MRLLRPPGGVHVHLGRLGRQRQLAGGAMHQHCAWVAVAQHVADALGGVARVDRHIGRTGLEDAQQANHQRGTALKAECNAVVGLYAQRQQMVSQTVGLSIELGEAQLAVFSHQRDGLRAAQGLRLEKTVQGLGQVMWTGAMVTQYRCARRRVKQRQAVHR